MSSDTPQVSAPGPGSGPIPGPALVTGAAGFLGRHLVAELLRHGRRVVALDLDLTPLDHHLANKNLVLPDKNLAPSHNHLIRRVSGDLAEAAIRRRALGSGAEDGGSPPPIETIFHLAAAHLGARVPETEFRRVNVEATEALGRDALAAGIRRFVHTSSVGVYGEITDPPADETSPCHPDLPYERTKLEGEGAIRRLIDDGLPAVILRPAWVYGPDCPRTAKLLRAIARRRFVLAGSGRTLRHCLHIDDMVRAFLLAEQCDDALGRVIVVGDHRPVTLLELTRTLADITGAPPPYRIPFGALWLAAVAAEIAFRPLGREPPLSRRTLKFFTNNTAFRTDRARRLLGFEPRHTPRSGFETTWRSLST